MYVCICRKGAAAFSLFVVGEGGAVGVVGWWSWVVCARRLSLLLASSGPTPLSATRRLGAIGGHAPLLSRPLARIPPAEIPPAAWGGGVSASPVSICVFCFFLACSLSFYSSVSICVSFCCHRVFSLPLRPPPFVGSVRWKDTECAWRAPCAAGSARTSGAASRGLSSRAPFFFCRPLRPPLVRTPLPAGPFLDD